MEQACDGLLEPGWNMDWFELDGTWYQLSWMGLGQHNHKQ
jgi:hypothetical protein